MTAISPEASRKVAFWSFVFSIAVVVIHSGWTAETELGRLSIELFRNTLSRMAVPFFFACSGFFLARHFDEAGWWRREVVKRIHSLLIPAICWTLVLACVVYVEAGERPGLGILSIDLRKLPTLAPLWYVRCLLIFMVLSPLFRYALERGRYWTLAGSYIVLFVFQIIVRIYGLNDTTGWVGFLYYGFSLEGLFFFLCGIAIQRNRLTLPSRTACAGLLLLGCVLIVLRLWLIHKGIPDRIELCYLIIPAMLVGIMGIGQPPALLGILRGCAFPIYLMHAVVNVGMRVWGGEYHVCNAWLEFFMGVLVPIVFVWILRYAWPRGLSILFGGRV